jgi:hypothetical protein
VCILIQGKTGKTLQNFATDLKKKKKKKNLIGWLAGMQGGQW